MWANYWRRFSGSGLPSEFGLPGEQRSFGRRPFHFRSIKRMHSQTSHGLQNDPLWYKDAIIYEAHVRAFNDSNADGMGDFKGLAEKLDYLEDLGVTAIWLLPFFPSPWKDDGYDISDFRNVHRHTAP